MNGKRIAIACQGGGSQCAFVAGALGTLLASGVQHRSRIVGLSGTSGGAITAALAWVGLLEEARGGGLPIEERIIGCWKDLSAQTPREILFDQFCLMSLRMTEMGFLPSFASSPASAPVQFWSRAVSRLMGRPEFTDLGALLAKHVPFAQLPKLVAPESPALLVGAADVLEGTFKVFSSKRGEITLESLLASAAIPTLFPAVWVSGHAYWDGIFSSNPPILDFLRKPQMGEGTFPNEIWIIQVNRVRRDTVPELPSRHLRSPQPSERQPEPPARASGRRHFQHAVQSGRLDRRAPRPFRRGRIGYDHGSIHPDVRRIAAQPRLSEQAHAAARPHRQADRRRGGAGQGVPRGARNGTRPAGAVSGPGGAGGRRTTLTVAVRVTATGTARSAVRRGPPAAGSSFRRSRPSWGCRGA